MAVLRFAGKTFWRLFQAFLWLQIWKPIELWMALTMFSVSLFVFLVVLYATFSRFRSQFREYVVPTVAATLNARGLDLGLPTRRPGHAPQTLSADLAAECLLDAIAAGKRGAVVSSLKDEEKEELRPVPLREFSATAAISALEQLNSELNKLYPSESSMDGVTPSKVDYYDSSAVADDQLETHWLHVVKLYNGALDTVNWFGEKHLAKDVLCSPRFTTPRKGKAMTAPSVSLSLVGDAKEDDEKSSISLAIVGDVDDSVSTLTAAAVSELESERPPVKPPSLQLSSSADSSDPTTVDLQRRSSAPHPVSTTSATLTMFGGSGVHKSKSSVPILGLSGTHEAVDSFTGSGHSSPDYSMRPSIGREMLPPTTIDVPEDVDAYADDEWQHKAEDDAWASKAAMAANSAMASEAALEKVAMPIGGSGSSVRKKKGSKKKRKKKKKKSKAKDKRRAKKEREAEGARFALPLQWVVDGPLKRCRKQYKKGRKLWKKMAPVLVPYVLELPSQGLQYVVGRVPRGAELLAEFTSDVFSMIEWLRSIRFVLFTAVLYTAGYARRVLDDGVYQVHATEYMTGLAALCCVHAMVFLLNQYNNSDMLPPPKAEKEKVASLSAVSAAFSYGCEDSKAITVERIGLDFDKRKSTELFAYALSAIALFIARQLLYRCEKDLAGWLLIAATVVSHQYVAWPIRASRTGLNELWICLAFNVCIPLFGYFLPVSCSPHCQRWKIWNLKEHFDAEVNQCFLNLVLIAALLEHSRMMLVNVVISDAATKERGAASRSASSRRASRTLPMHSEMGGKYMKYARQAYIVEMLAAYVLLLYAIASAKVHAPSGVALLCATLSMAVSLVASVWSGDPSHAGKYKAHLLSGTCTLALYFSQLLFFNWNLVHAKVYCHYFSEEELEFCVDPMNTKLSDNAVLLLPLIVALPAYNLILSEYTTSVEHCRALAVKYGA